MTTRKSEKSVEGKIIIQREIVEKIAGLAGRGVEGIHSIGKSTLIPFGDPDRRGIDAEVGEQEVALDLEVVIEYGVNLSKVIADLRARLAEQIKKMAGRTLVEVNVNVVGIHMPEEEKPEPEPKPPRVR